MTNGNRVLERLLGYFADRRAGFNGRRFSSRLECGSATTKPLVFADFDQSVEDETGNYLIAVANPAPERLRQESWLFQSGQERDFVDVQMPLATGAAAG